MCLVTQGSTHRSQMLGGKCNLASTDLFTGFAKAGVGFEVVECLEYSLKANEVPRMLMGRIVYTRAFF